MRWTTNGALARAMLVALAALAACGRPEQTLARNLSPSATESTEAETTLDIGTWNLEWFGSPAHAPTNDSLQVENAAEVIHDANLDVWGFSEIVDVSRFRQLLSRLPSYQGLVASDQQVLNGPAFYDSAEQKLALAYRTSVATLLDARLILTEWQADFAGRPPLQVVLSVTLNGQTHQVVIIALHAKCCSDDKSWAQRQAASSALKAYLDANLPDEAVWIIGDFNDDLDSSITSGRPSPYANFLSDKANYAFPSLVLTDRNLSTTLNHPDPIDHHLNTNEAHELLVANSVEVMPADRLIANYRATTSDHLPVVSRYAWKAGQKAGTSPILQRRQERGSPSRDVVLNEIGANEPSNDTRDEFVELVNMGTAAVDLSGYTLEDAVQVRHVFAPGSKLEAGKALVIVAGRGAVFAQAKGAVLASTGALGLNNDRDTITLKDGGGTVVQTSHYGTTLAKADGVSVNRSEDGSIDAHMVKHTVVSNLPSSPGVRASGLPW